MCVGKGQRRTSEGMEVFVLKTRTRETWNVKPSGLFFQRKEHKTRYQPRRLVTFALSVWLEIFWHQVLPQTLTVNLFFSVSL